jgi:hypothetical protein
MPIARKIFSRDIKKLPLPTAVRLAHTGERAAGKVRRLCDDRHIQGMMQGQAAGGSL